MFTNVFAQLTLAQVTLAQAVEPVETEAEEGGGFRMLLPVPEELWGGIIAFTIVFLFIWKWAVPVLNEILAERQAAIAAELELAEKAKVVAESLLTDYRTQISGAKDEASKILNDARDDGESVKGDIVSRAEGDAELIRIRVNDEIVTARDRAAADLRGQVADLSIGVAEKMIRSTLDDDAQRELIDRYIDELGGVK